MKKLTTFINGILNNGNATLIESTEEKNVYSIITYKYNLYGYLEKSFYQAKYDSPLLIDGEVNLDAREISLTKGNNEEYDDYEHLLCRLIKDNLSPDESIVLINLSSEKNYITPSDRKMIINMANNILSLSNHSIVCSVCTSLDYLEKYLIEEALKRGPKFYDDINIKKIEQSEDDLMARINHISNLSSRLESDDLTQEEYNSIYPEWIKLYEDREFHPCLDGDNPEQKKRELLTTK